MSSYFTKLNRFIIICDHQKFEKLNKYIYEILEQLNKYNMFYKFKSHISFSVFSWLKIISIEEWCLKLINNYTKEKKMLLFS